MLRRLKVIIEPGSRIPIRLDNSTNSPPPANSGGQSLIEYLVIVALVAVGGIGIMRTVGQSVNVAFGRVAKSLGAEVDGQLTTVKIGANDLKKRNLRNFMNGTNSRSDSADSSGDSDP